jgi:hypothetical protein
MNHITNRLLKTAYEIIINFLQTGDLAALINIAIGPIYEEYLTESMFMNYLLPGFNN